MSRMTRRNCYPPTTRLQLSDLHLVETWHRATFWTPFVSIVFISIGDSTGSYLLDLIAFSNALIQGRRENLGRTRRIHLRNCLLIKIAYSIADSKGYALVRLDRNGNIQVSRGRKVTCHKIQSLATLCIG